MKKCSLFRQLLSLAAIFALTLPLTSCGDDDKTLVDGPDVPVKEFMVTIDDLTYESITFTITPPSETPVFYVSLFSDTDDLDFPDEELAAAIIEGENFRTFTFLGPQTLTFQGLIGHSHYRMIYFAYDEASKQMLSKLYRSERITTPDSPEMFNIEVENITGVSADLTITPPDGSMTYCYYLEEKSDYETRFDNSDNLLIQNDFAYWKYMAWIYEDTDWLDFLKMELVSGVEQSHTDPLFVSLMWDTEYLVYAYGLDEMGTITHPMTKKIFKTATPTPSDNTFEAKIDDLSWEQSKMGFIAKATVTPKNPDESYYAVITNKNWYDWFFTENNTGRSDNTWIMYQLIRNCPSSTIALSECLTGTAQITTEDWPSGLRPVREYAIFVFGFNEQGATTDLTVIPFTTPERPL